MKIVESCLLGTVFLSIWRRFDGEQMFSKIEKRKTYD